MIIVINSIKNEEDSAMKYEIVIKEILKRTISVEAESQEQALGKVEDAIGRSEIILDADDFDERIVSPGDYWINPG